MAKTTRALETSVKAVVHPPGKDFVAPERMLAFSVTANVSHFHRLRVTGVHIPSNPFLVLATVRAPENDNPRFSDSFALTVNQIEKEALTFKIWRVDSSNDPSAPIRIDFLLVL
jgi:hypothetical protein